MPNIQTNEAVAVLVLGFGAIGRAVVDALRASGIPLVNVADPNVPDAFTVDILAEPNLIRNYNYVINTIPLHDPERLVPLLVACVKHGVHYLDTNEDRETARYVRLIGAGQKLLFAPQCGLAPGFINVLGGHLWNDCDAKTIDLRVGALTHFVDNEYLYTPTWSPAGVVNQALNNFEVIEDRHLKEYESMFSRDASGGPTGYFNRFYHRFYLDGVHYECFPTSGGLGTMIALSTHNRRPCSLMYRTIRLAGHAEKFRTLVHSQGFNRGSIVKVLDGLRVENADDHVIIIARSTTTSGVHHTTVMRVTAGEYFGVPMTAIQKSTVAGVGAVLELHMSGKLPSDFIHQHEIDWHSYKTTRFFTEVGFTD